MKNRVMLFYDLENFKSGLIQRDRSRFYDIGRVQYKIIKLLCDIIKIDCSNECLIRAYAYTGEYTDSILKKIEKELKLIENKDEQEKKKIFYEKIQSYLAAQKEFFRKAESFNFFELRSYPLKYENNRIFQKGVDVQLAVDLVSNAYQDNFDIAVICSGDIDLLESLKILKRLGKKVIVMSHCNLTAKDIKKEADFYIDVSKLRDTDLDEFSAIKNKNYT